MCWRNLTPPDCRSRGVEKSFSNKNLGAAEKAFCVTTMSALYHLYVKFIQYMNSWVTEYDRFYVDLVFRKNVTTFHDFLRYVEDEVLASATSFDNTVYLFWFIVSVMILILLFSFYLMSKPFGYPGGPRKRVSRRKPKFLNEKKFFRSPKQEKRLLEVR